MLKDKGAWGSDPEHPILPRAFEYEIVGLNLEKQPVDGSEPFLDLTLSRATERRVLRFWSPQDLEIERGGPVFTGGLALLDMSSRCLDGLTVRVADVEATFGAIQFVARAVEKR